GPRGGLILSGRVESPPRLFAGGFLLGAAAIVRPTALLFVPPLLLWVALRSGWNRRALAGVGLLIAGCLVPVLPVAVANARSTPRPVLIQGNGGLNFYIGNSPGGGGVPSVRPGEAWDQLEAEPARKGFALPADQDRYFYAKTFREIASSPGAWAGLVATKALWTVQADEIRDTFSYGFFRGESAILRFLPGFGLVFPLAVAGLVFTAYSRARPVLLWIWLATALATCVLLVVASRYRLPAVPAAAVLAGAGVAALIRREGAVRGRRGAAILAAGAAAVVCHLRVHEPSHRFSEEWSASGTAWNQEKERGAALRDFDLALSLDEGYAPARVGRGVALLNLGRLDQAEAELRRAVALEPKSRVAVTELGLALERLNRPAEAEAQYRAALALDPEDLSTRRTLGDNLLRQGRAAEAVTLLREVILRAPGHAPTRLALARALGAAGRAPEAIAEAREATRLDSERSEAWLTLAMLALDTGNLGQADTALREAERTGAAGRDTSLGRALLYRAERLPDRVDRELRPLVRSDPGFRPAVELFLENARQRGAEREALDFLRERAHRPS
ncbi:MAG: tetratricopeptide repeat protein, partial [Acidobacteriota bacterium]